MNQIIDIVIPVYRDYKTVRECLETVLPALAHAVEIIKGTLTEHVIQ